MFIDMLKVNCNSIFMLNVKFKGDIFLLLHLPMGCRVNFEF